MRFAALTLTLVFTLLAQALPRHHAHATPEQPQDHGTRPHVHLHDTGHGHSHDPHHRHDEHLETVTQRPICGLAAPDHDADAVYIETQSTIPSLGGDRSCSIVSVEGSSAIVAASSTSVALPPPEAVAEPPPRIRLDGPPLYLRNLSLRI